MAGPIENFALQLLSGTKNGTVKWKTSADPQILLLEGNSGLVKLKGIDENTVRLEIFKNSGELVGSTGSDPNTPGPWQPWESALRELFPIAVLQARGTTEVIQSLEEELGLQGSNDDLV
jgi:hypothetical protein